MNLMFKKKMIRITDTDKGFYSTKGIYYKGIKCNLVSNLKFLV